MSKGLSLSHSLASKRTQDFNDCRKLHGRNLVARASVGFFNLLRLGFIALSRCILEASGWRRFTRYSAAERLGIRVS